MNKAIYRLVWNSRLGAPQVVSEVAKSKTCGGSVSVSGPGARTSRTRGKAAVWPLALLSMSMASLAFASANPTVTTGADSGAGSLRDLLPSTGSVIIGSGVSTVTLTSDLAAYNGLTRITASAPVTITGGSLVGSDGSLLLTGSNVLAGALTSTISGRFTGVSGNGIYSGTGAAGGAGSAGTSGGTGVGGVGSAGSTGKYFSPSNGSAAISGSFFAITNNAVVTGGLGVSNAAPGTGGAGGNGGVGYYSASHGGAGGNGGAGVSGGAGSAGGAGVSGSYFSVINNASISGGNGSVGTTGGTGGTGGQGGNGGAALNSSKYGNGGNGGAGGNGGNGGAGGAGITGSHIKIVNTGTIQGGNGGIAGTGGAGGLGGTGLVAGQVGANGQAGSAGVGGAGIVATGGGSAIYNAGTISGGFANNGSGARANAIELSGGDNKLVLEAGSVINGNVVSNSGLGGSGDVLVLGGENLVVSTTFDLGSVGAVGSAAQYQGFADFEKEGASTWTLTGTDTFTQNWTVSAGTLAMASGSSLLGTVDVSSGATLNTGDASIGGDLNNAGSVVVGTTASPFATLTVGGAFTQSANSTLQVSAYSATQYSKLSATGNVQLDGTLNVDVKSGNTLAAGNQLANVVSTTGTLSGQFSHVTDNSLLFNFTPVYNSKSVDLNLVGANSGTDTGSGGGDSGGGNSGGNTGNTGSNPTTVVGSIQALGNTQGRGAAVVLDQVIASSPGGRLASYLVPLTTQAEVSKAVSEVLPQTGGSTVAAQTALTSINRVVQARSDTVRGVSSGDSAFSDDHFWIKPFGSWADLNSNGGTPGVESSVGGMAFGLDGSLNDRWVLGTAFVYAKADTHNSGNSPRQSLTTDVYQLVGYGTYHLDDTTDLSFQIDGGQNRNDGKRDIDFAGLQAKSSYNSWTAHAGVVLDRTFSLTSATRFTPSVRADYTWIKDESYTEKGADALDLQAKSRNTDQFIVGFDGKLAHDFTDRVSLSGTAGAGYDFQASRDSVVSSFAGAPGAAFTTYGGEPQRWLVRGGTELSYKVSGPLQLSVRYDVEKRINFLNQTASAEARWAF
jgi:autotransporter family porin